MKASTASFICPVYFARDILHLLNEAIDTDKRLCEDLVQMNDVALSKRFSRLQSSIKDGMWRMNIVFDDVCKSIGTLYPLPHHLVTNTMSSTAKRAQILLRKSFLSKSQSL